ncbi:lipoyl(octanoyl) transferase LipB [Candidiatus Paracoxiella cheracis]|uniref:lipoyl(octanoyl) transferase LipB n=1 Tax=Candidiatus Paracoxiella cheracis TaxID=3405120 RepID=UPI003BF54E92
MNDVIIRQFKTIQPYHDTWEAMKIFTNQRSTETTDEIWLLEHLPVFTQGLAGKPEHVLNPHHIPIVQTDRGGQITYHGPGQLMVYLLLDIRRLGLQTRTFVRTIEQIVVDYLKSLKIEAYGKEDAPGVYVDEAKICSIGLRVKRGFSYHGLAFNIDLDLTPFSYINPCGFKGLQITQVKDRALTITMDQVMQNIMPYFLNHFGYNHPKILQDLPLEMPSHEQQVNL